MAPQDAAPPPEVLPPGTLYVVATPIGNLRDITLRALEILGGVDLIAAEDTRLTRRLLERHGLRTPMHSYHARNAAAREPELIARLRAGARVALVTDAGTPAVSDPGADLVAAWGGEGGRVVPIPGPSAALAALSATGIAGPHWAFEGFLPRSGRERRERLARLAGDGRGAVVFEAANRLAATLRDLADACGERPGAVCRELTKLHEQIVRGSLPELAARVAEGGIPARGEVVIVVGATRGHGAPGPSTPAGATEPGADPVAAARVEVARRVAGGEARGAAAKAVSAATGIPRRALYEAESSNRPTSKP